MHAEAREAHRLLERAQVAVQAVQTADPGGPLWFVTVQQLSDAAHRLREALNRLGEAIAREGGLDPEMGRTADEHDAIALGDET